MPLLQFMATTPLIFSTSQSCSFGGLLVSFVGPAAFSFLAADPSHPRPHEHYHQLIPSLGHPRLGEGKKKGTTTAASPPLFELLGFAPTAVVLELPPPAAHLVVQWFLSCLHQASKLSPISLSILVLLLGVSLWVYVIYLSLCSPFVSICSNQPRSSSSHSQPSLQEIYGLTRRRRGDLPRLRLSPDLKAASICGSQGSSEPAHPENLLGLRINLHFSIMR
ncbi:uncharacterized protein LOC116199206 [Punica granatum]|uniref:Uncharacterized protein LOC116199206 n=1 Tax=Punica granatum TaxID=22663 RepID=A0A6P8CV47_PUNGR|nr:uncharacterized protein LOC116199206 [Punica granatum]